MKRVIMLVILTLTSEVVAQDRDFDMGLSGLSAEKRWISVGEHVSFQTSNLQMSLIEAEIVELETRECRALLKRDTLALRQIWMRDFTLDERLDKVIDGRNPLPYYISVNRMIENFSSSGNLVFTSGYEIVQRLTASGKLQEPVKRSFFHTWTNRDGSWKLSTKTH